MPSGIYIRTEDQHQMLRDSIKRARGFITEDSRKKVQKALMGHSVSEKLLKRMTGSTNPNWNGGISPANEKARRTIEYKLWRKAVFERDNYTCVACGAKNGEGKTVTLHADHIKQFAFYPELRVAIDNGMTLCKPCHQKTPTYGRGAKN